MPQTAAIITPTVDPNSIAVLAFANLSDDKENEYFSDGISEELLTVLQKIPGLRVAARTSAFSFKGKNTKVQEIGRELGVATLVEGSVRKSGNNVRISAYLIRVDTGEQVWSESFTRDLSDVFAVQTELAQIIVERLEAQFRGGTAESVEKIKIQAQVKVAARGGTKNVEAYQRYLQGQFFAKQLSHDGLVHSIASFRRAIELDAGYALAWAALSNTLSRQLAYDSTVPSTEYRKQVQEVQETADQSLALEPDLAEGLLARGTFQLWFDQDLRAAGTSVRRALEKAPSNASGLNLAAEIANMLGAPEQGLALLLQAVALDPLNNEVALMYALSLANTGRLAEAETAYQRALELNPIQDGALSVLGVVVMRQGRLGEAEMHIQKEPTDFGRNWGLAHLRWAQGNRVEADAAMRHLEAFAEDEPSAIAQIHAYRGEVDQAFEWLERAHQKRDPALTVMVNDWHFKSLQSDPRWEKFWRQLGLTIGTGQESEKNVEIRDR